MAIYGYCRVSTKLQKIERQIINIKSYSPDAIIFEEKVTGTQIDVRKEFTKLLKIAKTGDTIIFDSVSRMSRNSEQGFKLYQELYNKDIELVFLKESYINTATYKKALNNNIELTGTSVDSILKGVNEYLMLLAKEQIKIAFNQSEKEVKDLQQRTIEGLAVAKANGKRVGRQHGEKVTTRKAIEAKKLILKKSKRFEGTSNDADTMAIVGIAKATFYRYIKELYTEQLSEEVQEVATTSAEVQQVARPSAGASAKVKEPSVPVEPEEVQLPDTFKGHNSKNKIKIIADNKIGYGRTDNTQSYTVKGTKREYITIKGKNYFIDEMQFVERWQQANMPDNVYYTFKVKL